MNRLYNRWRSTICLVSGSVLISSCTLIPPGMPSNVSLTSVTMQKSGSDRLPQNVSKYKSNVLDVRFLLSANLPEVASDKDANIDAEVYFCNQPDWFIGGPYVYANGKNVILTNKLENLNENEQEYYYDIYIELNRFISDQYRLRSNTPELSFNYNLENDERDVCFFVRAAPYFGISSRAFSVTADSKRIPILS